MSLPGGRCPFPASEYRKCDLKHDLLMLLISLTSSMGVQGIEYHAQPQGNLSGELQKAINDGKGFLG